MTLLALVHREMEAELSIVFAECPRHLTVSAQRNFMKQLYVRGRDVEELADMMPFIPLSPWIAFSLRAAQVGLAAYDEMARMSIEKTAAFAEAQVAVAAAAMAGRRNPAIANRALTPIKRRVYANGFRGDKLLAALGRSAHGANCSLSTYATVPTSLTRSPAITAFDRG